MVYFSCDPCQSVSPRHWDRAFSSPDFWCFQHKLRPAHSAICDRHRTYCLHPWTIIVTVYTLLSLIGGTCESFDLLYQFYGASWNRVLSVYKTSICSAGCQWLWTPRFTYWVSHFTSWDVFTDKTKTLDHSSVVSNDLSGPPFPA